LRYAARGRQAEGNAPAGEKKRIRLEGKKKKEILAPVRKSVRQQRGKKPFSRREKKRESPFSP